MANTRYCFFDTETTNNVPNTGFTQLLEITAILVDPETFEIEDILDEKCRLNKSTIFAARSVSDPASYTAPTLFSSTKELSAGISLVTIGTFA